MKKYWPFLLLNVLVSGLTILAVLLIWNATHPTVNCAPGQGTTISSFTATPTTGPTLPAKTAKLFTVETVIGAGDIQNEHIHFKYLGSEPLSLQGWQINHGSTSEYTFPAFTIYKGGAFDLYSRAGVNSTIELYMSKTDALWQSGDTLVLIDSAGNQRLNYSIP